MESACDAEIPALNRPLSRAARRTPGEPALRSNLVELLAAADISTGSAAAVNRTRPFCRNQYGPRTDPPMEAGAAPETGRCASDVSGLAPHGALYLDSFGDNRTGFT